MPRKAKEKIEEIEIKKEKKVTSRRSAQAKENLFVEAEIDKNDAKKSANKTKKGSTDKKSTESSQKARKSVLARIIENIEISNNDNIIKSNKKLKEKTSSVKKSSSEKKSTSEKAVKSSKKSTSAKKITSDKKSVTTDKTTSTKKNTSSKKINSKKDETPTQIIEYYDLPLKYGNTIVKLLAQTPKTLFVYWEVSNSDIDNFKKLYGEDFFSKTVPILIVHNISKNTSYEIEINDFANCWYLNTEDSDCKFDIELARKFINTDNSNNNPDYLHISSSNDIQSPNDHILFEKLQEFVVFRNVNDNSIIKKNIKSFKFLEDLYKFYKDMYDEDILNNPSSHF